MNACAAAAESLKQIVDTRTLLIASSDLTHYGNQYSFRPFKENVLESIEKLDNEAIQLLQSRNAAGFKAFLERTEDPICGATAIQMFFQLLPDAARGVEVAYDQSGKKMKTTDNSVSFATIKFYDPSLPVDIKRAGGSPLRKRKMRRRAILF